MEHYGEGGVSRRAFLGFLGAAPVVAAQRWNFADTLRRWWKRAQLISPPTLPLIEGVTPSSANILIDKYFTDRMLALATKNTVFYEVGKRVKLDTKVQFRRYGEE